MMKNTTADPVKQLEDATRQRQQLAASLPELTQQAEQAAATRKAASDELERVEGDALVGVVADAVLAAARARCEAAVTADRKAAATLRQAQQDLTRLDDAIARLKPEADAVKIAAFRARQEDLVQQLRDGLQALVPINDALDENFRAAEAEFPHSFAGQKRGEPRGYLLAAGLSNLSWSEFRYDRYASNGGRLRTWFKAVDAFLHPESTPAPRPRATATPKAAPPRDPSDPWHPLEGGQ